MIRAKLRKDVSSGIFKNNLKNNILNSQYMVSIIRIYLLYNISKYNNSEEKKKVQNKLVL